MPHRFVLRKHAPKTRSSITFAEPLERRLLLINGATVPLSTFSETSYQSRDLAPFTLSTQTVAPNGYISVTFTAQDPVQIACSDARPKYCTLDGAPVTATEGSVSLYRYDAPFPDPDDGAVIDSPAGTHTATFQIIPAAVTEGITEEDDANGNAIGYAGPWIFGAGSNSQGNYSSAQPFNIVGDADTLSFLQQPSNAVVGAVIKPPVTVAVQNSDGSTDTGTTDSVTLSLVGGTALGGTVTEPAVNGIATFSDLSIATGGSYTLSATDGTDAPVTSNGFSITSGKLVFITSPHNGDAGVKLKPAVRVELESSTGKKITTADGSTVTLAGVDTADRQAVVALTGNAATVKRGIATFSDLVLSDAGTYQVQASDAKGDAGATSASFEIKGDHLAFKKEPSDADADSPIPFTVELEDAKNHPVTDESGELQFTLTPVADTTDTKLAGDADQPLADGLYANRVASSNDAVAVDYGGTYTLTATEQDDAASSEILRAAVPAAATGSADAPTPATSKNFKVDAPELDFIESSVSSQTKTLKNVSKFTKNEDLAITATNSTAVVQSTDTTMSLEGEDLSPETPNIKRKIFWTVVRNTADIATGPDPTVTQSSADPLKATLSLNAEGSFNVICYYDANGSGTFDPGEQLKVLNLAIVAIVVKANLTPVTTNSSYFGQTSDNAKQFTLGSGDFVSRYGITATETVEVIGGGSDGMLGVSSVHVGWVQNGTSDNVQYKAASGATVSERLRHGTFPILDASYTGPEVAKNPSAIFGTGPGVAITAAPGPTRDPVIGADPAGGQDRTIADADSPEIGYSSFIKHSPVTNADGTLGFNDTLTAYSSDFDLNYVGYLGFTWNATYHFTKTSLAWINSGSSVTASAAALISPTTLAKLGVQFLPPVYIYSEGYEQQPQA